ncbi:MAG: competence/damage-inducible protein A [Actinomycetota bacterium]
MRAEIIGVGTELLLGQIANTNAQIISQSLASIGVDVHRHVAVGDNIVRMVEAFEEAMERADATIITGGLGPTPDDITREAVAELTGRPLIRDDRLVETIEGIFTSLGRAMPEDNLRQAERPEGSTSIDPEGTAPGFFLEHDEHLLFALPGVPWEMKAMLAKTVLPELKRRAGDATIVSREVLVIGLGESHTHQRIGDIVARQTNPTIAYLAGKGQVRVRLTAKATSEAAALALIRPVEDEIRERLEGAAVPGGRSSVVDALAALLRERGMTIAAAESLTGGGLSEELSKGEGASDYFLGGLVLYATAAKREVGGIDPAILEGPGAVSAEAAGALAEAAAQRFGADLGVSTTGVAGPTEQEGKPVGTVYVAATVGGATEVRLVRGYGDRDNIRGMSVTAALELARRLTAAHA